MIIRNAKKTICCAEIRKTCFHQASKINPINEDKLFFPSSLRKPIQQDLCDKGYTVIDGLFEPEYLNQLRQEVTTLHSEKALYANNTHVVLNSSKSNQTVFLEKKNILETELDLLLNNPKSNSPYVETLLHFARDNRLRTELNEIDLKFQSSMQMVKIQHNTGQKGCFPMHFDSYGGVGEDTVNMKKKITSILYLNPEWTSDHGGQLILYPFPYKQVKINPLMGRLVLFSSQEMLHRVLPAFQPRFCLTKWCYALENKGSEQGIQLFNEEGHLDGWYYAFQRLYNSHFRKHLIKLYFHVEWRKSLIESHDNSPEFEEYMGTQNKEVQIIKEALFGVLQKFKSRDDLSLKSEIPGDVNQFLSTLNDNLECIKPGSVQWFK